MGLTELALKRDGNIVMMILTFMSITRYKSSLQKLLGLNRKKTLIHCMCWHLYQLARIVIYLRFKEPISSQLLMISQDFEAIVAFVANIYLET